MHGRNVIYYQLFLKGSTSFYQWINNGTFLLNIIKRITLKKYFLQVQRVLRLGRNVLLSQRITQFLLKKSMKVTVKIKIVFSKENQS